MEKLNTINNSIEESSPEILLTQEEIDFFRDFSLDGGARKAQAMANFLDFPHLNISTPDERESDVRSKRANLSNEGKSELIQKPELGGFEFKTAQIVAQQWHKIIDNGIESGLLKQAELVINVIHDGEHKMLSLKEYRELLIDGTEGLKMVGVIASLDGDNDDGPSILMRSDMDALQMSPCEVKHQCGHNIHTGWSVMNMDALVAYKNKFGNLPFKKAIFVSESNEEGNFSAGEHIAPLEMIKSGFFEKFGKVDIALGQHVIASIPEGEIRIDSGFHGATDYVQDLSVNEQYDLESDNDPSLIAFEMARLVNDEFGSDNPNDKFGKMQIVEDDPKNPATPDVYIRTTEIKEKDIDGNTENLAINSIPKERSVSVFVEEETILDDVLKNYLNSMIQEWAKSGFTIKMDYKLKNNRLDLSIDMGNTSHVAIGGPNPTQIMGEVLNFVRQYTKTKAIDTTPGMKFGGTIRIRGEQYDNLIKSSSQKIIEISEQAIKNLNLQDKVSVDLNFQNGVAPTINNSSLASEARLVAEKAGLTLNKFQLPVAGAESFGTFREFLKDFEESKMLYVLIGGMDKNLSEDLRVSGKPLPPIAMHHSEEFMIKDTAIPYGIILSTLLIEFSKGFNK